MCSLPVDRVRMDDLKSSVVLDEQLAVLKQLSQELTPKIWERVPMFLGSSQLLTSEDNRLLTDLCQLRKEVISQDQGPFKLRDKPSLLPQLLLKLKRFCESKFIACVAAIEPKMEEFADGDEPL